MGAINKPLPDFCREETAAIERPQEALLTSNSVLLLIYGLTMGLVMVSRLEHLPMWRLSQEVSRGFLCLD